MPDPSTYVVCRSQQEVLQHCRTGFEFDPFTRECSLTASQADNRALSPNNNGRPSPPRPTSPNQPAARNPVTTTARPRPQPRPATDGVAQRFDSTPQNPCANHRDGVSLKFDN